MINAKVVYNLAWRLLVTATTQMLYQAQQYEMVYEMDKNKLEEDA